MNLLKLLPVAVAALIVSLVFVNSPAEAGHGGKCAAGYWDTNVGGHNCQIIPAGHGCTNMGGVIVEVLVNVVMVNTQQEA